MRGQELEENLETGKMEAGMATGRAASVGEAERDGGAVECVRGMKGRVAVDAGGNQRAAMGGQEIDVCVFVCTCVRAPLRSVVCDRPTPSSCALRVCLSVHSCVG